MVGNLDLSLFIMQEKVFFSFK